MWMGGLWFFAEMTDALQSNGRQEHILGVNQLTQSVSAQATNIEGLITHSHRLAPFFCNAEPSR